MAQADTMVSGAGNPMAWDRYAYTSNNPLKYIDPSGHSEECAVGEAYCDAGKQNYKRAVYNRHKEIVRQIRTGEITDDLEGLALLSEFAASLTPNCTYCFIQNMGATLTGHSEGTAALDEVLIQSEGLTGKDSGVDYEPYYLEIHKEHTELMQTGYSPLLQDPGEGGNQAHHYWFYVQVGFESGYLTGRIGSALHETVLANGTSGMSYQDYALGVEGSELGAKINTGAVSLSDVGNYIRSHLSPTSSTVNRWYRMPEPPW